MPFYLTLFVVCLPLVLGAQSTSPRITERDLRLRVSILADDSLMGRETGSHGDDAAARYVEREFRRFGLVPMGDSGSFFQTVPLVERRLDFAKSRMLANGALLRGGTEYLPARPMNALPRGLPRAIENAEIVYGGVLGDSVHHLGSASARGRFVILGGDPVLGDRAWIAILAGVPRELRGAAGIGIVALDGMPAQVRNFFEQPVMRIEDGQRDTARVAPIIWLSREAADVILGKSGGAVPVGAMRGHMSLTLAVTERAPPYPARNIVAVLPGSAATLRDTYVSISAHHDHVGWNAHPVDHDSLHAFMRERERLRQLSPSLRVSPAQEAAIHVNIDSLRQLGQPRADSIFNGADDDASGTAAMLEIAERLSAPSARPRRSILFLSHTAEEKGLLGSRWFSDHPTVSRDSIIATMDMDMVGRGSASDLAIGAPNYLELIGTRRQSTQYGDLIDSLNNARARPFHINYAFDAHDHPEGDWCRADHFSLARFGIPAAAFSTSYHGDYHQVTDESQYIDYPHLAAIAEFVGNVAVAVANRDRRLVIDKPKPSDSNARCVQ